MMKQSLGARTLALPTPLWIVGTYGANGVPNIMAAAWGGITCSAPPCVGVSLQKPRATYDNIVRTQAFTISIPGRDHVAEADYAGIVSGKDIDKFAAVGLTAVKSDKVNAPYVQEFPLVLECKLAHSIELGTHTQFIGEILDVKAEAAVLDNGVLSLAKVDAVAFSTGERAYYSMGEYIAQAFSVGLKYKQDQ